MATKPTYEELEQRVKELEQAKSERKQAEDSLQKSEGKYRTIKPAIKKTNYAAYTIFGCLK